MILNLSRDEADVLARVCDATAATMPDDEWTPALITIQAKLWRAIDRDDVRFTHRAAKEASTNGIR